MKDLKIAGALVLIVLILAGAWGITPSNVQLPVVFGSYLICLLGLVALFILLGLVLLVGTFRQR